MDRYAITFPIRPGSSERVAELLSGYPRPELRAEAGARLLGTTVFLRENTVVRVFDIQGDYDEAVELLCRARPLQEAGRRLAPYLEPGNDISDESGLRRFLREGLMRVVTDRRAPLALRSAA